MPDASDGKSRYIGYMVEFLKANNIAPYFGVDGSGIVISGDQAIEVLFRLANYSFEKMCDEMPDVDEIDDDDPVFEGNDKKITETSCYTIEYPAFRGELQFSHELTQDEEIAFFTALSAISETFKEKKG